MGLVLAVAFVAGNPEFGCAADPLALRGADGCVGFLVGRVEAVFDFDEGQAFATDGDQVDLAGG